MELGAPGAPLIVVIDGLNVARNRGFSDEPAGDARALRVALQHFLALGCKVHAIVPARCLDAMATNTRATSRLAHAECLTPYLRVHVHPAPAGVDEDAFILRVALEATSPTVILSNDLFRDHVARGGVTREWVDSHRAPFMFVEGRLLVLPPTPAAGLLAALPSGRPPIPKLPASSTPAGHCQS